MTKEELKSQVEEMLYQILKFVQQLDEKEQHELKIELACSCLVSVIDFDFDRPETTINNLKEVLNETAIIALDGTTRVLSGKGMTRPL